MRAMFLRAATLEGAATAKLEATMAAIFVGRGGGGGCGAVRVRICASASGTPRLGHLERAEGVRGVPLDDAY